MAGRNAAGTGQTPGVLLQVHALRAWYGEAVALREVNLFAPDGHVTGLIGPNGAGKTTTLRAIAGVHRQAEGQILVNGVDVRGFSPWKVARSGISLVREGAAVLQTLTIAENLAMGGQLARKRKREPRDPSFVYELFPQLAERKHERADSLSGGQRQMLALATAIVSQPMVLLLDEPSAGLAWAAATELFVAIAELRSERICTIVAEQSQRWLDRCADEVVPMDMGQTRAPKPLLSHRARAPDERTP